MGDDKVWLPTEKNIEDYNLLRAMIISQKNEFDLLSKKKADGQLNKTKIKMVNRVLKPLKELFEKEKSHTFLDILDDDEMPTYSDVVLIISQYLTAIGDFKKKYYLKDVYLSTDYSDKLRWMTEEFPFDYYKNVEGEEEYEDYDEDL